MVRIRPFALVLAASTLALTATAGATTMQRLDVSELNWVADLVVEAVVEGDTVERVEGQEYLRTVTSVRLTHVIKGDLAEGERIDVLALGGRLGGEVTTVHSVPVFAPDERVLLFLEQLRGEWSVVGWSQGKYTLIEEPDTGRDVLLKLQPPRGLTSYDERLVTLPAVRLYVDDLVDRLRQEIDMGFVPEYQRIAGIPASKDARFRAEAKAAGKFDPRWEGVLP